MQKCQHDGCTCDVPAGVQYCSDHCRDHAEHTGGESHSCQCGHPECQGA
jgi:hypothetical protein